MATFAPAFSVPRISILPAALITMPPPLPLVVCPDVVMPPAVVITRLSRSVASAPLSVFPGNRAASVSSEPAVPELIVTVPEASNPVSRNTCSPALTVMEELGPVNVTPVSPITPPATSTPNRSTSVAPLIRIELPALRVTMREVVGTYTLLFRIGSV